MAKLKFLLNIFLGIFLISHTGVFACSEERAPQKIISLGPAITEEIYILGEEDKLVGRTAYCRRPSGVEKKEKVGTAIEVNLEKVVSLEPDMVLATSLTSPEAKEKLKDLGVRVVTFPAARDFNGICEQFSRIGRIVGKEKEAEEILNAARHKVYSMRTKVRGLKKPRVVVQMGTKPLITATRDSFINDFIEFAGGINNVRDPGNGRYSRERVLEDNPDVITIVTMGINGEEEKRVWQRFKTLNAVKNNRIYIIDSYEVASPTPLTFVRTLRKITGMLHPRLEGIV